MPRKAEAELPRSKAAVKADITTEIATAIMAEETARRVAKTERLRAERLARDAAAPPPVVKKSARAKRARPA